MINYNKPPCYCDFDCYNKNCVAFFFGEIISWSVKDCKLACLSPISKWEIEIEKLQGFKFSGSNFVCE